MTPVPLVVGVCQQFALRQAHVLRCRCPRRKLQMTCVRAATGPQATTGNGPVPVSPYMLSLKHPCHCLTCSVRPVLAILKPKFPVFSSSAGFCLGSYVSCHRPALKK